MAKVAFTAARVAGFKCPAEKKQAFLWDATAPGLGLRTTPAGRPAYVFQAVYQAKDVRLTIGSPDAWTIPQAQTKARELQRLIDEGVDPRTLKREALARAAKELAQTASRVAANEHAAVTVGQAWGEYLEYRKSRWGDRTYRDHVALSKAGGKSIGRGTKRNGMTIPGPIYPLLAQRLGELSQEVIESWALKEGKDRPTSGRLAWRYLKAFLNWCTEEPAYKALVPNNPARGKRTREAFGTAGVKTDALLKEQLPIWFQAVRDLSNPCVTAYLQTVLLTGARPGEILDMHWEDLNTKWKGLTIRDKVEGERVIPLTPYVSQLLATLPRRNKWVFSSATAKDGKLSIPRNHHQRALQVAGIDPVTLHGLRRSFKSLTEWLEIPAGVVAQIMGHKPSATAEKHYTVRPLDLLRVHHERIEAWIVSEAGVPLGTSTDQPKLRSVA